MESSLGSEMKIRNLTFNVHFSFVEGYAKYFFLWRVTLSVVKSYGFSSVSSSTDLLIE